MTLRTETSKSRKKTSKHKSTSKHFRLPVINVIIVVLSDKKENKTLVAKAFAKHSWQNIAYWIKYSCHTKTVKICT